MNDLSADLSHVFSRSIPSIDSSFRRSHFAHASTLKAAHSWLTLVRVWDGSVSHFVFRLNCRFVGHFFRPRFLHENAPLASRGISVFRPVSSRPVTSFSLVVGSSTSLWSDRESHRLWMGRTFTCINGTVINQTLNKPESLGLFRVQAPYSPRTNRTQIMSILL